MFASELRKKSIFFVGLAATIILILIVFPFVELPLKNYIASFFGATDSNMGVTATVLFENFLRIIKIVLWMTLAISIIRYLDFLIFGAAFRSSAQSEISSLLRNVFSIIIYIVAFFV
ncbi:MAG: hypothetical protein M3Q99_12590, partial [Acidobacteriota bacterium]|nr:hypothetical protein [Acidobacteriota bacterium]